ncbi:MAG: hypothetical protein EB071_00730 [Gammaproteobacteria bacterium]|nr:hypothetical protein [Gammaproteobacteria bacterium]
MNVKHSSNNSAQDSKIITQRVLVAVLLGILVGSCLSFFKPVIDPSAMDVVIRGLRAFTDLFLRLIKKSFRSWSFPSYLGLQEAR